MDSRCSTPAADATAYIAIQLKKKKKKTLKNIHSPIHALFMSASIKATRSANAM